MTVSGSNLGPVALPTALLNQIRLGAVWRKSPLTEGKWLDLPDEVWLNVFRNLGPNEFDALFYTCRKFQSLMVEDSLLDLSKLFPNSVLVREDWIKYSDKIGITLEEDNKKLTPNEKRQLISEFMKADPYSKSGVKKWQTHTLLELPKGLTLRPLVVTAEGKNQPWIRNIYDPMLVQYGDKVLAETRFVLITNTVADEETRGKTFDVQKGLVDKQAGAGYVFADVLTAVALNVLKKLKSGKRLYGDKPWTYTCCIEEVTVDGKSHRVVVGGFSPSGLHVYFYNHSHFCHINRVGAAAVLRMF